MKTEITAEEGAIIQQALQMLIEDMDNSLSNPHWTNEARILNRKILSLANSAREKIIIASGKEVKLDPFVEGDENEFIINPKNN